jgi:hypothetical protein
MDDSGTGTGGTVTSEAAFRTALRRLVRTAVANGVDVRGGWAVHGDDRTWDVEVTAVARRSTTTAPPDVSPTSVVVEAVAARRGVDPTELPPLHDAVDGAVLDAVDGADPDSGQRVTFDYAGYRVTYGADGVVTLDGGQP